MVGCLLYAILRGLHGSGRHPLWTGLLDLFFCFSAIVLFGACSAYAMAGQIRLFSVVGFALGFAIFYAGPAGALTRTISHTVSFFASNIKRASNALNRLLAKFKPNELE